MAIAASIKDYSAKILEEDLTCYICYDLLREPRDLECSHVYCLLCLQEWVEKKPIIECPECRYITIVPQGGLGNLKSNLRLKIMAEKYAHGVEKKKGVPMCPNHEGERQHFFCVTCGIRVCHNCLVLDHARPQHDIKELKVITKTRKVEMKRRMDQTEEEVKKTKKEELNGMETKLLKCKENPNNIEKRIQQDWPDTQAQGHKLMVSVESDYRQNLATLGKQQNHTEDTINWLQSVVDAAADHFLIQQQAPFVDQIGRLSVQANTHQIKAPSMNMDSVRVNPGSSLQNASRVDHDGACSEDIDKLKFIFEFGRFQQALDIAATRTGVAVADYEAKYADIYCKENADFECQFSLNVNGPLGVAATSEGRFFISDCGRVKVITPAHKYVTSWPDSVVADKITTTPDDMIVIGSHLKKVISVHRSNGELIRAHQVDCKFFGGIASNGKQIAFTTGSNGKICGIDFVTGQTLWTADMIRPLGICYEQKSNTLLVAGGSYEPGQNVILQYSSTTGRAMSRLAIGLYVPCGMTTTYDNKLVVADSKTLKVYQIKFKC